MAKMLDFNSFNQPEIPVVFNDGLRTTIHVTVPSEKLIEKLEANRAEITSKLKAGKGENFDAIYDFVAELMSFNKERITFTGAALRNVYNVNSLMLMAFMVAYLDFVNEIKSAKN